MVLDIRQFMFGATMSRNAVEIGMSIAYSGNRRLCRDSGRIDSIISMNNTSLIIVFYTESEECGDLL